MSGRWVAVLACHHEAPGPPAGMPPRIGSYITCPARCLGGPKRVTAVRDAPVVYVQDTLL